MKFELAKRHEKLLKGILEESLVQPDNAVTIQYRGQLASAIVAVEFLKAVAFMKRKHGTQTRKYTGGPYWEHPMSVANLCALILQEQCKPEMVIAALLHDTVEDTDTTFDEIEEEFGEKVRDMVFGLTDISTKADGNREARKERDLNHLASQSADVKTIKCADILHNSASIIQHDPDFARVWMREKQRCLEVLRDDAHPLLYLPLEKLIEDYFDRIDANG